MEKKLVTLMILDGFGNNPKQEGNAIQLLTSQIWTAILPNIQIPLFIQAVWM